VVATATAAGAQTALVKDGEATAQGTSDGLAPARVNVF